MYEGGECLVQVNETYQPTSFASLAQHKTNVCFVLQVVAAVSLSPNLEHTRAHRESIAEMIGEGEDDEGVLAPDVEDAIAEAEAEFESIGTIFALARNDPATRTEPVRRQPNDEAAAASHLAFIRRAQTPEARANVRAASKADREVKRSASVPRQQQRRGRSGAQARPVITHQRQVATRRGLRSASQSDRQLGSHQWPH